MIARVRNVKLFTVEHYTYIILRLQEHYTTVFTVEHYTLQGRGEIVKFYFQIRPHLN